MLTKLEDERVFAAKLTNPLGATVIPESFSLPPALNISVVASATATAPPAPPVPFQPLFRAAEAMLSATVL